MNQNPIITLEAVEKSFLRKSFSAKLKISCPSKPLKYFTIKAGDSIMLKNPSPFAAIKCVKISYQYSNTSISHLDPFTVSITKRGSHFVDLDVTDLSQLNKSTNQLRLVPGDSLEIITKIIASGQL